MGPSLPPGSDLMAFLTNPEGVAARIKELAEIQASAEAAQASARSAKADADAAIAKAEELAAANDAKGIEINEGLAKLAARTSALTARERKLEDAEMALANAQAELEAASLKFEADSKALGQRTVELMDRAGADAKDAAALKAEYEGKLAKLREIVGA